MVTDPEGIWMECRREESYFTAEAATSSRRLFPPYFGSGLGTSCGSTAYHKRPLVKAPRRSLMLRPRLIRFKEKIVTSSIERIGVGIDTARYGHRVGFLDENRQPAAPAITVQECGEGYRDLEGSLRRLHKKHPRATFHVRIDAAGQYAVNLEAFLRSLKLPISLSIGQPKRNKDYQRVHFPKRKSDDTESQAMARYAVVEWPDDSPETPAEFLVFRVGRREGVVEVIE